MINGETLESFSIRQKQGKYVFCHHYYLTPDIQGNPLDKRKKSEIGK